MNSSGEYKRGVNKIAHYLSTTRNKNLQNKYTPLPAIFWAEPFKGGRYVLNFERPSVYDTGRPIPFFRKFRITCPPRSANLIAPRLSKKPWERISRKGARDRRNPTAGRENQQRRSSSSDIVLYGWNTSLPTRSYQRRVPNITLHIKPSPPWALIHSRYAISTDRFDPTSCSLVDNLQHLSSIWQSSWKYGIFGLVRKVGAALRLTTQSVRRLGW